MVLLPYRCGLLPLLAVAALAAGCSVPAPPAPPEPKAFEATAPDTNDAPQLLVAEAADSRVDLKWRLDAGDDLLGYHVYRGDAGGLRSRRLTDRPHPRHLYSDFVGENGLTHTYYVAAVRRKPGGGAIESAPSVAVTATTRAMSDEELLTSVQKAAFRYFWDYGHPVSGLARERTVGHVANDTVTTGGSGFGLMTIVVGVHRGFVTRAQAAERVLKMLRFLDGADRFHGAWPHWMNGRTGRVIPFFKEDDGGDLVETSFLAQGLLTVRRYFSLSDPVEREIRYLATRLWEGIEWNWYARGGKANDLTWHWSPNHAWKINHRLAGFNECLITYLLAIASPTHPVAPELYRTGWAGHAHYTNGKTFYGHRIWVGPDLGGPLFFTHYSFLGFDPRGWHDGFCNYFENNRNISLVHRAYCAENPGGHAGYSEFAWGLTASDDPWGYRAHEPGRNDNGTLTPTAALSAMPYTPEESIATLKHFYREYGARLWGEFGFRDAFHPGQDWFAESYLAIDQGTIAPMIENHRSQLCWTLFMSNPEIAPALQRIGWVRESD